MIRDYELAGRFPRFRRGRIAARAVRSGRLFRRVSNPAGVVIACGALDAETKALALRLEGAVRRVRLVHCRWRKLSG